MLDTMDMIELIIPMNPLAIAPPYPPPEAPPNNAPSNPVLAVANVATTVYNMSIDY